MEFKIKFSEENTNNQKQLIHLKSYLEKAQLDDLESVEVERTEAKAGEMGVGVLKGISAILLGGSGPFTKLAEALIKYVEILRSELILTNKDGEELIINAKLNKKSINELVDKFYSHNSKKENSEFPIENKEKKIEEKTEKKDKTKNKISKP